MRMPPPAAPPGEYPRSADFSPHMPPPAAPPGQDDEATGPPDQKATLLAQRPRLRRCLSIAGVVVSLASVCFLAYLVYRDRSVLLAFLQQADARRLPIVFAWYAVATAIGIAGYASIMTRLGARSGFLQHARIYYLSNVAKRLPGALWYVGGRVVLYGREGVRARSVIVGSAIEGALILLSGAVLTIPFLTVALPSRRWLWIGVGLGITFALLNPKSVRWLLQRATSNSEPSAIALRDVYAWLGIFISVWILGGVLLAAIIGVFQPLQVRQLPWIIGTWACAGTVSMLTLFLPSNFGVSEVTLAALLSQVMPAGAAVLVAVAVRLVTTAFDIAFGGLALLAQVRPRRQ